MYAPNELQDLASLLRLILTQYKLSTLSFIHLLLPLLESILLTTFYLYSHGTSKSNVNAMLGKCLEKGVICSFPFPT